MKVMATPSTQSYIQQVMKWLMSLFYVLAGFNHFVMAQVYVHIMPPYLPFPELLVSLSGLSEIGLGLLLLIPSCTSLAARGIILLLIAVFPANIHMALHPELTPSVLPLLLWLRLPFQAVLILWAYGYRHEKPPH